MSNHALSSSSIRNEMTCPICAGIFIDPRILECGHVFCLRCIFTLVTQTSSFRTSTRLLRCPLRCESMTYLLDDVDALHRSDDGDRKNVTTNNNNPASFSSLCKNVNNKNESLTSFLVHPERVDDSLLDDIANSMKQNARRMNPGSCSSLLSPGQLQQIRSLYQDLKRKQKLQKHHQDIARSVMKLPKSLIIGNVSLIMRQQELREEKSTNYSSCSCEICFEEVTTEEDSDSTNKARNTSSSSIVCCESCGMFLCLSCKNNEANEHGLFCGKTASITTPQQSGGNETDLTLAGIQPCLYSKVLAMTSALKNRLQRQENEKQEKGQEELPDKNNHALLQDFSSLESCHIDYLPFRCVTVKCEAKPNINDDGKTHQNHPASLSSFKMLYRVWIRNGMKPRIEPYVPLLQEFRPSPERKALFDLQVFVDVVADLVRSFDKVPSMMFYSDLEGDEKISLESKDAFEKNISLLFELRAIANICLLLQSTVLPLIRSQLVSTAVVGCQWAMKIRESFFQNTNKNDTTRTSSLSSSEQLAFSYMNRHLAHEEEDANETGRMILAHLESLQKEVYEARKKSIKQYKSIVDSGWNNDSELGSVVKRLNNLGVVCAADATNDIEEQQCTASAANHHTPSTTSQQRKPFEVLAEKFSWLTSAMSQLAHQNKSFQENDDHADSILASNQNQLIENAFPSLLLHEVNLLRDYSVETGKLWAVLDWMPFCNLLTDDEEREPSSSINFGSSSSLTAFKKVVDLRRRHVRSVLEFSVKPASHYYNHEHHQKLFSLLLSSKKKAEKLREKDEQQLQLLGKGGFEKAIVGVLSNAAKCERQLHSSIIERAQLQIQLHQIVLDREDYDENLQSLDENDEYHNKQSAIRKPLFMSKFHPFRSTDKEQQKDTQQACERKLFLQSDIIDSKFTELIIKCLKELSDHHNGLKAFAKSSSIQQQRKQQAEEQQVHLLSSIDPRLVVPKSSTRISDASKLKKLPTAHRCEAEKLALQRFSIDVESVFWNATTTRQNTIRRISEEKKRKKVERNKIKKRESNNDDNDDAFNEPREVEELDADENQWSSFSSSDDDDGEVEVESEVPTAMKKKKKASDFSSPLLEFGNDSEASSEFEGDSDYYDDDDDDYNDGLVGDDFSDTDDDDDSNDDDESELRFYTDNDDDGDDDDNDRENETNNVGEQANRNNEEANQLNSGGDKKSDRSTEARRIRMNQFPQLRFKASTISHRILHQPHVLARCRFSPSNKNKNKDDKQNSDDVVEDKEKDQKQSERVLLVVDATTASRYQVVEYEISSSTNNNRHDDDDEENQFSNDLLARFARRANGGIGGVRRRNNNQMRFEDLEWDPDLNLDQLDEDTHHARREEESVDNIYSDDDNYILMDNNNSSVNNNSNSNSNMNLFTEHADDSEGVLIAGQQYSDDDNSNNNNSRSRRAAGSGTRGSNSPPMQEPRTVLHRIMRTSACFWIANVALVMIAFGMSRKKTSNMN